MKKHPLKSRDPEKPRRLSLSRETIQRLDDPRLLELARGGTDQQSIISRDPTTTWGVC